MSLDAGYSASHGIIKGKVVVLGNPCKISGKLLGSI